MICMQNKGISTPRSAAAACAGAEGLRAMMTNKQSDKDDRKELTSSKVFGRRYDHRASRLGSSGLVCKTLDRESSCQQRWSKV